MYVCMSVWVKWKKKGVKGKEKSSKKRENSKEEEEKEIGRVNRIQVHDKWEN